MKHNFYDMKKREKVTAEVTEKVIYQKDPNKPKRYAFRAISESGGNLTAFVGKELYENAQV